MISECSEISSEVDVAKSSERKRTRFIWGLDSLGDAPGVFPSGVQRDRFVKFFIQRQKSLAVAGFDFFLLLDEFPQVVDQAGSRFCATFANDRHFDDFAQMARSMTL